MTVEAPLSGRVALVYGGTGGIGLACARGFLEAGAEALVLIGRTETRGEQAAESLRSLGHDCDVRYVQGDAASVTGAEAGVRRTVEAFGRVDIMLSSAGGSPVPSILHRIPLDQVQPTIDGLLMGAVLPSRAVLPVMMEQQGGVILTVASDAAKIATPGESIIGAAMAGIVMFTRGLAIEAKRSGVRANCLTPSIVRGTPQYDVLMADPFSAKLFKKAESMASLGVVEPQDLAALAVFLASPAATKITGQAISANGGISAA
ncbi:SDR family NAD(P)-dependent oxidoreductase [Pelagibius sp. Alg239-R121]|uniref:SDR family NAD(P)-dependent oxidoreductase n=1 Tax=Pelagibius sp. Alg239-R121 TaxID=2993448 RepID=UPI0024A6801D|nr:SDR family oxidoreductase [Pelagibius sp. Alg239-R121]